MALNPAQKKTRSESLLLEQRLNNLYRQAYRETLSDSDAFWKKYETQIADKYQQYKDGKITQQDYWSWVNGHKKMGKRIDNLSANIADRMVNTGNIASSYINNTTPKIFAESANYEAYTIEKELGFSMQKSFSLIDDDALKALIEGNSTEVKAKWKNTFTDPPKIYSWTYSKVQDSIHTGILKGESVPKIASRIQQVTESDRATAIRNARTSITSAYNQGQMATFERAAKMGIEVKKEWIATNDIRTRDSHAQLNGIRVGWDDKFPNGLKCPADPSGRPEEVYNCRCSMARAPFDEAEVQSIVGDDKEKTYQKQINTEQTYNEWKNNKEFEERLNQSGAKNGALNDSNDPKYKRREEHAERLYAEYRNSSKEYFVNAVSNNTKIDKETVSKAYKHVFEDKHVLDKGYDYFDADYDMAESWRRLRTNDKIQEHDKILIMHESLEYDIMNANKSMSYEDAHNIANDKYNYGKALDMWKKNNYAKIQTHRIK